MTSISDSSCGTVAIVKTIHHVFAAEYISDSNIESLCENTSEYSQEFY
jgi:hypothetical protein